MTIKIHSIFPFSDGVNGCVNYDSGNGFYQAPIEKHFGKWSISSNTDDTGEIISGSDYSAIKEALDGYNNTKVLRDPKSPQIGSESFKRNELKASEPTLAELYPKYYKDVSHLNVIDVYRVIELFEVTDPTAQHALKKLLLGGQRTGKKEIEQDFKEARDTLSRGIEMKVEDSFSVKWAKIGAEL